MTPEVIRLVTEGGYWKNTGRKKETIRYFRNLKTRRGHPLIKSLQVKTVCRWVWL